MGLFDKIAQSLIKSQSEEVDALLKTEADQAPDLNQNIETDKDKKDLGRTSHIEDPYYANQFRTNIAQKKPSRVTNLTLKNVSVRDWLVSAIIQIRVDTLLRFSRPQKKKFDMGFRVVKRNDNDNHSEEDRKNIQMLEDYIYHCGRTKNVPTSDKIVFGDFLKLVVRDALTFGHIAVEKIPTKKGGLHRFRPVPAESTYLINREMSKDMIRQEMVRAKNFASPQSDNDPKNDEAKPDVNIDKYK